MRVSQAAKIHREVEVARCYNKVTSHCKILIRNVRETKKSQNILKKLVVINEYIKKGNYIIIMVFIGKMKI